MSYKDTKTYSILNNKCPRCHEGNFFETNNMYNMKRFAHMNERCPVCGEDFRRETGFYFGAAYVSYALTVAFGIGLYALLCMVGSMDTAPFLFTFCGLMLLLLPPFYRLSRLIWINFFVPYRGKAQ